MTAATFALWPLAQAREIPAAALFRARILPPGASPPRPLFVLLFLAAIGALATLTVATAVHKPFALAFVGGALGTLAALRGGAEGLMALAKRIPARSASWRLALANLHRPGSGTTAVVLSLGVGLAVLVAVAGIEGNLSRQIAHRLPEGAPAYFFLDIQDAQVEAFDRTVDGLPGTSGYKRVASLRGRIVAIAGTPAEKRAIDPAVAWAVRGDRSVTYAKLPPEGAEISAGAWWPADYSGQPLISLDAGVARGFGIGIGDSLTVNVMGRDIEGTIASLREIDWRSLRFDFAVIFSPGVLEAAPHGHIAALRVTPDREEEVEKALADAFPNVTAIRVREALEAAQRILEGVGGAIRSVGGLTILAGSLVLAGAIAATRRRRAYEAVVFKVLGATRRQVMGAYLLEYAVLGFATAAAGTAVGVTTGWAVVRHLLGMGWTFLPGPAAWTALLCLGVTMAAGTLGTLHALGEEAVRHLRNE
ncbi:MAG: FtsX-like permease family protein [Magnetospirillum sp. WYHS-4]